MESKILDALLTGNLWSFKGFIGYSSQGFLFSSFLYGVGQSWNWHTAQCFVFLSFFIRDKTQCHKTLMIPAGTLHSCSGKKTKQKTFHLMFSKIQAHYFWLLLGKYFYVGCNTQFFFISTVSFSPGHIRKKKKKKSFCLLPGKNPIRKCVPRCHAD